MIRFIKQALCTHRAITGRQIAPPIDRAFHPLPAAYLYRCEECGKFWIKDR
jgi:hypothetical protein